MFFAARFRRLFVLILLVALGLLPGCKKEAEVASPIFMRIDGRSLTLDEFRRDFERSLPSEQNFSAEEKSDLERSFLVQVIDRELTLAEADRLGINVSPAEVEEALAEHRRDYPDGGFERMLQERGVTLEQWRRELKEGLLMEKVVGQAVYKAVTVTEEEIKAYYQDHREEFDRPNQVRARQIVVGTLEEGQMVLGLLRQGEAFEQLAREYSLSPDGAEGGDLGFFASGQMPPEFDEVVFTLPVGRNSDLVKSEYGYHIFRVEERREAKSLTLAEVRETIEEQLQVEKEEKAYQEWLRELRGRAAIEIDGSLL